MPYYELPATYHLNNGWLHVYQIQHPLLDLAPIILLLLYVATRLLFAATWTFTVIAHVPEEGWHCQPKHCTTSCAIACLSIYLFIFDTKKDNRTMNLYLPTKSVLVTIYRDTTLLLSAINVTVSLFGLSLGPHPTIVFFYINRHKCDHLV